MQTHADGTSRQNTSQCKSYSIITMIIFITFCKCIILKYFHKLELRTNNFFIPEEIPCPMCPVLLQTYI